MNLLIPVIKKKINSLKYGRYVGLQAIKKPYRSILILQKYLSTSQPPDVFGGGGVVGRGGVGERVIIIFLVFSLINSVLLWV